MTTTETITWTDFYTDPHPGMADTDTIEITETCHRCDGRGEFQAYRGIANGVCFACNGINPTTTFTATVADRRAKAKKSAQGKATRARAKARKRAKNAAANEKWVQGYPALHLLTRIRIRILIPRPHAILHPRPRIHPVRLPQLLIRSQKLRNLRLSHTHAHSISTTPRQPGTRKNQQGKNGGKKRSAY